MSRLSQDQIEKRASIQKTATIWGGVVAVIVGLIAIWALSGQGAGIRFGGAGIGAVIAGFLVHRASFNSGAKSAKCAKCNAAFSISRTDRHETLAGSEPKEQREEQEDKSVKVTTWTEETYDVADTYTCAKCGDATTKTYQTTRRKEEAETIEPAPKVLDKKAPAESGTEKNADLKASGKSAKAAKDTADAKPDSGKSAGGKSAGGKSSGG